MLIDSFEFKDELKNLWHNVFGDDEEYISLLFDYSYTPEECFAFFDKGKIVAALYLLESEITSCGESFKGRYLYAAATEESHRGKGIMESLIIEAQSYCRKENLDFISLVPANDYLYTYYSKFGFFDNMHKLVFVKSGVAELTEICDEEVTFEEYFNKRREYLKSGFHFADDETIYASSCLEKSGYRAYKSTDTSFYLADDDDGTVLEYISAEDDFDNNTLHFCKGLKSGVSVSSAYDLSLFGETKEVRYGMIYPVSQLFNNKMDKNYYMNIALD